MNYHFGEIRDVSTAGAMVKVVGLINFEKDSELELLCFPFIDSSIKKTQIPFRILGRLIWIDHGKRLIGVAFNGEFFP